VNVFNVKPRACYPPCEGALDERRGIGVLSKRGSAVTLLVWFEEMVPPAPLRSVGRGPLPSEQRQGALHFAFFRDRLDAARVVVRGRVHQRAHGIGHEIIRAWDEQVGQVSPARVEPGRVAGGRNDERHPIMEIDHGSFRVSRDHRAGLDDLPVGIGRAVPDPSESKRFAILPANQEWLLRLVALLPLEEAIDEYEASTLAE
jgi:hypothetical protein